MVTRRGSKQELLFPVRAFMPKPYEEGSIYDMLARFGEVLFRRSDFPESDPSLGGTIGWCPVLLTKLVVLQAMHGWTDRETVRRGRVDMQVKACLGLGIEQNGPSQPTLCRHRQRMQELGLDTKYQARLRALLEALELVRDDEPVLIDSAPVDGAGQQLDTYNLLAAAVRKGLRELAARQERDVAEVAADLDLSPYLGRSIKGHFEVDWSDEASRRRLLARLVDDAVRIRTELSRVQTSEASESEDGDDEGGGPGAAEIIDDIIAHDVDINTDGEVEGIKQRAAGDRLISVTDPDMRNGRKSASRLIAGFKVQVVATVMHGFIVMTRVIRANEHDGHALASIAGQLGERGLRPEWWAGDHAYGTIANHLLFDDDEHGELVAPMARASNGGRFTKDEFAYDFETKTLTCPAGVRISKPRWQQRRGRKGRLFVYPSDVCGSCAKREQCVSPTSQKGRSVFIVDEEERVIRKHLERREEAEFRERLAHRPAVERAIAGFAQCGGKQARRFGMRNVGFDANLSALAYNLRRLGSLCARDADLAARAVQAAAASVAAAFCLFLHGLLRARAASHKRLELSTAA
jgi:hypothetical protein